MLVHLAENFNTRKLLKLYVACTGTPAKERIEERRVKRKTLKQKNREEKQP